MDFLILLLLVGGTFGICWLVDKGFTKAFRSAPQHASGKAVRLNKHFGGIGTAVLVLGIFGMIAGLFQGWVLIAAGGVLVVTGIGLITYYMSFGLYYDQDTFLVSTFGKQTQTYRFEQIKAQQLFIAYGKTVIELYLEDGRAVQLQDSMTDVYKFMDHAFAAWLRQKGLEKDACPFHKPDQSCWFPPMEE